MTKPLSRVFLVDDDSAVRESLDLALNMAGFATETYASGEAFLDAFPSAEGAAGCLVLDMRMPGMSGLEVQQTLIERQIELPIIFMSGHSDATTALLAIQAGAIDFLIKPFRSQELLSLIASVLGS